MYTSHAHTHVPDYSACFPKLSFIIKYKVNLYRSTYVIVEDLCRELLQSMCAHAGRSFITHS